MTSNLTNLEFQLFKKYIHDKCGIDIADEKAYLIETRLSRFLVDFKLNSFNELYQLIIKNNNPKISESIIDAITTNETLWFRDKYPWIIMEELLLPTYVELLRKNAKSKIRIWSAAASTGQEAYSIAMCIHYYLEKNFIKDISLCNFEIIATDISQTVLEIAKKGKYDSISIMRGLDQNYKDKYFKKDGMVWHIDDIIKNSVKFQHFNLQNSFMYLGKFDVVFCRYVLIYFSDDFKKDISKKLMEATNEEARLFIGASELYNILENDFTLNHYGNGTYYSKKR